MTERPIRVLVGKPGLDGHDKGARVVALALRDAGMEVVYTGLHRTPEEIVAAALQEDVDVIGLSMLSGAHVPLTEAVRAQMTAAGLTDAVLVAGGVIPERDVPALSRHGVDAVFPVGTPLEAVVTRIRELVAAKRGGDGA